MTMILIGFISSFTRRGDERYYFPFDGYLIPDPGSGAVLDSDPPAAESVHFLYEIKHVQIPESQVRGTAHISIGPAFAARLYDSRRSQFLFTDAEHLRPEYSTQRLTVMISQQGHEDIRWPLPLLCIQHCGDRDRPIFLNKDLPLELSGDPQQYPSDIYRVSATVSLELPDGIEVKSLPSEFVHMVSTSVQAALALRGKDIYYIPQDTDTEEVDLRDLQFGIVRDFWSQTFIYSVLFTPLLLALVIGDLIRRMGLRRPESAAVVLIGLAAVLLTLLPLRAVLVPPDIPDLTRVDRALTAELMLFLSIFVLGYSRSIWKA
jgi:hypothetical protein